VKVLSVVGNRPQFIKSGPVSDALRQTGIEEVTLHTGQHYDPELSQVFFEELRLAEPRYRLEAGGRSRDDMLALLGPGIREVIADEKPDWVLVYGDTNSTLGGARASASAGVPLAHVEAGLRSHDLSMPEEHNRIETDLLSQLLFAPDERSRAALEQEGVGGRIEVVGDVMMDANLRLAPIARTRSSILERLGVEPRRYVVATLHREANVAEPRLGRILAGLRRLNEPVVFPAHPRTRAALQGQSLRGLSLNGLSLRIIEPLGYLDFAALASQARVIVTDSGGLQKEAYWYGVPCVTARPSTEWVATVELGANVLVDDDPERLVEAVREARMPDERPELYGDGHAAERIAAALYASRPK
jgi:UDP-N-acetylglucosamine 2-epimerase